MPTVNLIAPVFFLNYPDNKLPYDLTPNIRIIKTPTFIKNTKETLYGLKYDSAVISQCEYSIEISEIDTYSQDPHVISPGKYYPCIIKLFDILFSAWLCQNMFQYYLVFIYKDSGVDKKQEITMISSITGKNLP
ncbi:MAG: hypothetical protein NTY14_04495, partial [Candidatus Omnitrophica bacterium]|nr:hypothetical protein [Candidatus Omnitrophota bacterium]